jgi:5-methylcytosine-specific restriction protein A
MMNKIPSITHRVQKLDTRVGSPAVERIRGGRLRKTRDRIGFRDEYTCQMCGHVTAHGEVDHITPLHLGGAESDENRQWLCTGCHVKKSEREQNNREA